MDFTENDIILGQEKRHGGHGMATGILFVLTMSVFWILLVVFIYSGSIMWSSCMFKNKFYGKTTDKRNHVKCGIIFYSIVIFVLSIAGYFVFINGAPDELSSFSVLILVAVGLLVVPIFGIISCVKYGRCTPVIEENGDDAENKNLKSVESGKLEQVKVFWCFSVYPHNKIAAQITLVYLIILGGIFLVGIGFFLV